MLETGDMRKSILTISVLASIVVASVLLADRAQAFTNALPAAIANAVHDVNAAEQIAFVCCRRCNWRGCRDRCRTTGSGDVYRSRPRRWRWW